MRVAQSRELNVGTVIGKETPSGDAQPEILCVVLGGSTGTVVPERLMEPSARLVYISSEEFYRLVSGAPLRLRKLIRGRQFLVYMASEMARPLLAHFLVIAALLCPVRIVVLEPGGQLRIISRWRILADFVGIVTATLAAVKALVTFILRASRRRPLEFQSADVEKNGRTVVYLMANSSFSGTLTGGSVTHMAGVVNALSRLGIKITFVSAELFPNLDQEVRIEQVAPPPTAPALFSWYGLLLGRRLARRTLEVAHGDIAFVYQRLVPYNAAGMEVADRLAVPWIVEYNGSETWVTKRWGRGGMLLGLRATFERVALSSADRIVVVSDVLRQELLELGIPARRIRMHPNGVDANIYAPERLDGEGPIALRRKLGIDRYAFLCTFVGTFGRWHGAEVLAQAIAEWHAVDAAFIRQNKIMFLFIGDGQMMPEVRRRLASLVYSESVRFAGIVPHSDAPRYLAASDILLSPHVANTDGSRFFGSPTKLFEYMVMAKPIVASDLEQIGEVLRPSLNATDLPPLGRLPREDDQNIAILCRPGVPEDIRRGIVFLAENPAWRIVLGRNARKRVLERYTWEHHVRAVLAG